MRKTSTAMYGLTIPVMGPAEMLMGGRKEINNGGKRQLNLMNEITESRRVE